MNKNAITTLLVVVLVIVLGYFIFKDSKTTTNVVDTSINTPNTATQAPVPGLPTARTGQTVVASSSTAAVSGEVNPQGAPTTYWYEYGTSTRLGSRTTSQTIGSGYNEISVPGFITGLRANTQYYFQLNAENRFGAVRGTTQSFRTNNAPAPQGTAPTPRTMAASNIARTAANLNGQVNPNGFETRYWFEYGDSNGLGSVTALQSAGTGTANNSVSVSVSGLRPATKYFFRVNAQNQYGTVTGAINEFTTRGPAVSGQPSAETIAPTSVTATSATFNGRVHPNNANTTYWFEYGTDSLLGNLVASTTSDQATAGSDWVPISANVKDLNSNTSYYYRLVARNSEGTVRGGIVSFKTQP